MYTTVDITKIVNNYSGRIKQTVAVTAAYAIRLEPTTVVTTVQVRSD
jgi:hypothetical protein